MEKLIIKPVGRNGLWELRGELDLFVKQNFDLLYEGATRLEYNIPADHFAPRRVQINNTHLHKSQGLKYASGHKYSEETAPTEEQLRETVRDLQQLIDVAAENIQKPFELIIVNGQE